METKMHHFLTEVARQPEKGDMQEALFDLWSRLDTAAGKNVTQDQKIELLARENSELRLYLAAIIRLLIGKKMINRDELSKIVAIVDQADGEADGQFKGKIV